MFPCFQAVSWLPNKTYKKKLSHNTCQDLTNLQNNPYQHLFTNLPTLTNFSKDRVPFSIDPLASNTCQIQQRRVFLKAPKKTCDFPLGFPLKRGVASQKTPPLANRTDIPDRGGGCREARAVCQPEAQRQTRPQWRIGEGNRNPETGTQGCAEHFCAAEHKPKRLSSYQLTCHVLTKCYSL